eukprot:Clim_evm164s157 gene=Clim_evmTU164s157
MASEVEAKITELPDKEEQEVEVKDVDSDEEEVEEVEEVDGGDESSKQSRSEKKARKALMKMGLKKVSDISRVTLRTRRQFILSIAKPDVYKSTVGDTYVIFGEVKIEDLSARNAANAAQQFNPQAAAAAAPAAAAAASDDVPELVESADADEEVDETGLSDDDIKTVMDQAGVSRKVAAKTLKENDGDIVETIMKLTK